MELRDEAEELALALELGFDSVDEAIQWADSYIAALDPPPYVLIEISLAGNAYPREVAKLLRSLPGAADATSALRRLIARMTAALDPEHPKAANIFTVLAAMHDQNLLPDAAEQEWRDWQYACDMADDGIGSFDDINLDERKLLRLCAEGVK